MGDRLALGKVKDAATRFGAALNLFWQDLTLREISGSCGDLGVFIPLVVGLVKTNGLDLGTTLIFTGLYNIITGAMFGIPMPVQPMKTIAAVALSGAPLTVPQIVAAGMFVSASVLMLGATGLMGLAQSLIPMAVIKGMQLAVGLGLARKGFQQVWYINSKSSPARGWWGVDGLCLGLFALVFILVTVYIGRDGKTPVTHSLLPTSEPAVPQPATHPSPDFPRAESDAPDTEDKLSTSPITFQDDLAGQPLVSGDAPACSAVALADLAPPVHRVSSSGSGCSRVVLVEAVTDDSRRRGVLASGWQRVETSVLQLARELEFSVGGEGASGAVFRSDVSCCGRARPREGSSWGFQMPAALVITAVGVVMTMIADPSIVRALSLGPSVPQVVVPSREDWRVGILQAGLPQLSLTMFNSVISVCKLSEDLFPHRPASPNAVATSVGAMNLVGGWFGAMPCCHGAGGLAAQTRFGAITGAAPIFLGLVKLTLGLVFGSSLFLLLQAFPQPLMGSMLVYSGMELASCARNQKGERGVAVLMLTAAVCLAMSNVAVGVLAGLIAAYSLLACDLLRAWAHPKLCNVLPTRRILP